VVQVRVKVEEKPQTVESQVVTRSLLVTLTAHPPVTVGEPVADSSVLDPQATLAVAGAVMEHPEAALENWVDTVVPATTVTVLVVGWLEQAENPLVTDTEYWQALRALKLNRPVESVVSVRSEEHPFCPAAAVRVMVAPLRPGSPDSWSPSHSQSTKIIPVKSPVWGGQKIPKEALAVFPAVTTTF